MDQIYPQLAALAQKYGAQKLVLFGSRARGDHGPTSDIDLAVYGMPEARRSLFWWEAEELPTLLKFDLVHVTPDLDPALLDNIQRDGVTLYEQNHELSAGPGTPPGGGGDVSEPAGQQPVSGRPDPAL